MKAKEMKAGFEVATDKIGFLNKLIASEIQSTVAVAQKRKATSNAAIAAIIKETDERWKAFCRLCPEVPEGLFKMALHLEIPASKILYP
jgi:hypothetical protein